ncbi:HDOD domain-containing protein [bacterium]|nr:HDOD domain-containing protein [bacterium]
MDREDIRLGIRNIKNLPTLPVIVSRILEVADDSGSSANELAELVARDMSVSAKVLNLANSAFYGFSRRITGKTIKPLPINLKLLLAFHVFFIIVAVLVSILLASLDPIVPYW